MLKYKFSDCEFLVPFNNLYRGMRITMKQDNRRFRFHPDWSFLNKMKFQPLIFLSFFLSFQNSNHAISIPGWITIFQYGLINKSDKK